MPKMKTHKSGAKRYRVSGSGKLMREQAFRGHLNRKKSARRKSNLDHNVAVHPANYKKVLAEIPYLKYAR
jgi:large subunit ribosomal protein L35